MPSVLTVNLRVSDWTPAASTYSQSINRELISSAFAPVTSTAGVYPNDINPP
ncbi:hypothetical protein D3C84_981260 [compost metagenome]